MAKYKDSFQTSSESLEKGGRGIVKAVRNEDPNKKESQAPPPKFDSPKSVSKVSPIRTLAEDMQTVTSEQNITLAGEALKRQSKKPQETPKVAKNTKPQ
ncbi:MAG: hypothetical protein U5L75_03240 [Candidatus Campbellbacteria bacterium]|nr:hypothetical protein [Candidatus Campbellbacteria bacterium]